MERFNELLRSFCQILIVLLFVGGSAGVTGWFMWTSFEPRYGVVIACCFVAVGLGMEALKPVAFAAAWHGIAKLKPIAIPGIIAAVACVSASFLVELQVTARMRAAAIATLSKADDRSADWSARRAELRRDLDALGTPRSSEELQPLIEAVKPNAGDCTRVVTIPQRKACDALPGLQSEAARAVRVAALRESLGAMDAASGPARGHSAEASALARFMLSAGVRVHPEALDDLLALAMVVLIQVASSLSIVVGPVAQGGQKSRANPGAQGGARGANSGPETLSEDHERIILVLRGAGGVVKGGQRQLSERLGLGHDRKRCLRVLRHMASVGLVTVVAERDGTTVALVGK